MNKLILLGLMLAFSVNAEQRVNSEGYPIDEDGYVIMDSSANDAYMDDDPSYNPTPWVPGAEYESIGPPPSRARELTNQRNQLELEKARQPVQKTSPEYGIDSSDGSIIYFY